MNTMKKKFLLLFSLLSILFFGQTSILFAQCDIKIDMQDSYGDGWNGASIKVYHGADLLGTATMSGSSGSVTISAPDMADISLVWTAGSYPEECGFTVTNGIGIEVYECAFTEAPSAGEFFIFTNLCSSIGLDINLIDLVIPGKVATGENEIVGIVRCERDTPITSFDVLYSIDGVNSEIVTFDNLNLVFNEIYEFAHPQLANIEVGVRNIVLIVENINGQGEDDVTTNNSLSAQVLCVNEIFVKNVVYEEGTGTWCGWCPRGLVGLNTMAHNYTDGTWIGIGVHNGDPMKVTEYDQGIGTFISGYPSGVMNREKVFDPGLSSLEPAYMTAKQDIPLAKIAITAKSWDEGTGELTVEATSNFAMDLTGTSYNVAMVIVESGVTGTTSQWNQRNYYSGGGNGNLIDWDGTNWANLPDPVLAADMVYNHVGRALIGGWNGFPGTIPADVIYGIPYVYVFTHTLDASYNPAEVDLVVMLIDATTGVIANAYEFPLEADVLVPEFSSDEVNGEAPFLVNFIDETQGGTVAAWSWDFNNDGIEDSNVQNPSYTYETGGDYSVALTVTNETGNSFKLVKTSYIHTDFVGLGNVAENKFRCYPNPAKDVINIQSVDNMISTRIFNVSGQTIYSDYKNSLKLQTIDISSFDKGVFFMELSTEADSKVVKFVVN